MSNLSGKTEKKALETLAKTLRHFEDTADLNVTAEDAFQARQAENLIKGIIESNGYTVRYDKGKGTRLTKLKNQKL